ncbi:MAG: hypothetical protein FWC40_01110 [Proteobacteria bacterium]|nr:hypothetical protein [Pseudomonadota bacterium]
MLRATLTFFFIFLAMAGAPGAWAQPVPSPEAKAQRDVLVFDVRLIAASHTAHVSFSDGLNDLKSELSSGFSSFTTFELIQRTTVMARASLPGAFFVPSDIPTTVRLRYVAKDLKDNLYTVDMTINDKFSASLKLSKGAVFFQAGLPYGDSTIIVAMTLMDVN